MLGQCWTIVCDAGPTLNQHWVSTECLLCDPPFPWRSPARLCLSGVIKLCVIILDLFRAHADGIYTLLFQKSNNTGVKKIETYYNFRAVWKKLKTNVISTNHKDQIDPN